MSRARSKCYVCKMLENTAYFVRGSLDVFRPLTIVTRFTSRVYNARHIFRMCFVALAYFITFSTYGTWLHGTDKGLGSVDDEHNQFGQSYVVPDVERWTQARTLMSQPSYLLDEARRQTVCDAIVGLAKEKSWILHAVHVRENHVHVVISADREPGRLMADLKARASRALNRAGFDTPDRSRWTRHGSTKHLFTTGHVSEKIDYTLNRQGARMACYEGMRNDGTYNEPRTQ